MKKACTQAIVDEAMRITSKDVRAPKCVRDGIVKRMYTEDDIREAITFGKGMELWKEEKQIEDFINSLNKQD
jgi:hypothetical protein